MKETKFKQTEVGMIPSDWEVDALDHLTSRITVGIANSATHAYVEHGVPMLRNQNIKPNNLDSNDVVSIDSQFEERYKNKRLKSGDLLVARTGYPGTACVVPEKYTGAQTFTTLIASPITHFVLSEYLCYYMNSDFGKSFFDAAQIGGAQKNVNAHTLATMPIPFPKEKVEQEKISKALSDVDSLIANLEKLIAKKKNIKQGAMQQLLTGRKRLPAFAPAKPTYEQTELGPIPADWEVKKIGDFTKLQAGGTPSTLHDEFWGGEIRWMNSGELNQKRVHEVAGRITELGLNGSSTHLIPANCVLVGLAGQGKTRGTAAINYVELCTNQSIAAMFPSKTHNSEFLYHCIDSRYEELRELSSGDGGRGGLNLGILGNLDVALPSLQEQTAIANILSDMDSEIQTLETKLAKYRKLKTGMMQQLLTGKIRLI